MAEHPGIKLTVIRFRPSTDFDDTAIKLTPLPANDQETHPQVYKFSTAEMDREQEKTLDEEALARDNSNGKESPGRSSGEDNVGESIMYEEREICGNTVESVLAIGKSNKYHLFLVGRGRFPSPLVADLADRTAECPELGPIGDVLASPTVPISASVLVIQQHDINLTDEVAHSKKVDSITLNISPAQSGDVSSHPMTP